MEKLIKLLNKYEKKWEEEFWFKQKYMPYFVWVNWPKWTPDLVLVNAHTMNQELNYRAGPSYMISKYYWFIKWLIDNNKIDWRELRWKASEISEACLRVYQWREYQALLMILAISDKPIDDLCDLLR